MTLNQEGIDRLVVSQASDESSWEAPVRVKRPKPAAHRKQPCPARSPKLSP
jgi:hypothetical protein